MSELTLEKLEEAFELVFPTLYYATDKNLEIGKLYWCKETDLNPEFIVCHPDDFETVKRFITLRKLMHIKDEPPNKAWSRLVKRVAKLPAIANQYYNDSPA